MSLKLNELSAGDAAYGFTVEGSVNTVGERAGFGTEVSAIGDFNGDGLDDFAVSAPGHDGFARNREDAGGLYIVYGGSELAASIADGTLDLTPQVLNEEGEIAGNGLFVLGERSDDILVGTGAGDVNGDGFDDVFMAAPSFVEVENPTFPFQNFDHRPGTGYILYGGPGAEALTGINNDTIDLAALPLPAPGMNPGVTVIHGELITQRTGLSYAAGGDLNGDGLADFALGTFQAPGFLYNPDGSVTPNPIPQGAAADGRVYAIYGQSDMPAEIDLTDDIVNGTGSMGFFARGFVETESDGDGGALPVFMGSIGFPGTLAMADLDGNGHDELLVGSPFGGELQTMSDGEIQYPPGGFFVLDFGTSAAPSEVILKNRIFLQGEITGEMTATGIRIENLGDVTGDGLDDVGIRAPLYDDGAKTNSGAVYGLFGDSEIFSTRLSGRMNLAGLADFRILGNAAGDAADPGLDDIEDPRGGGALLSDLSGVGDVNGDGVSDFAVSFPNARNADGAIYVVLGRTGEATGPTSDLLGFDQITRFDDYSGSGRDAIGMSRLDGEGAELAGAWLSGPMDLNGDGKPEILVGAPGPLQLLPDGSQSATTDGRTYVISNFFEDPIEGLDLTGTVNADLLQGAAGNDTIRGLGGNDTIYGGAGNDSLEGGAGDDLLGGGGGDDLLLGGDGNDSVFGAAGADTLLGGAGDDVLGTAGGDDRAEGGDGDDALWGALGNDTLLGGNDNDTLGGADGHDSLDGGAGNDEVWGANGNDTLSGGAGNDTLGGYFGNDSLDGGTGDDELWGADGSDTLNGGAGSDQVGAGTGNDTVRGGDGNDGVFGGPGNDLVLGGSGNDSVFGAGGDDTVDGGAGNDTMFAGAGADVILFSTGTDRLEFFSTVEDVIDLSGVGAISGFADLATNHLSQVAGNAVIDDGLGNTLTIVGVGQGALSSDDFIF